MKKFLTAGAALVGFGLSNLALAHDGTITITGHVSSSTCTISTELNQSVPLDPVSQSSLGPGQNAGFKAFPIGVSNCAEGTKVKAKFEIGPNVDPTNGTLKNTLTGVNASNVAIQLFNKEQKAINLATGANNIEEIVGASKGATLGFFAAYLAPVGEDVKPGDVSTEVTYTMTYE
ncbi:fimbrial protein [Metapseudomonas otitidis]|uniref:fimbrial protein n=1 Tax=Metapseudomonas otitidis TaxID=319939 RepID=UPI0013F5E9B2|nr:fimbrial protein [Pseudomonas otitidis]